MEKLAIVLLVFFAVLGFNMAVNKKENKKLRENFYIIVRAIRMLF